MDGSLIREGENLQRKLGVRWSAVDWDAFIVSKIGQPVEEKKAVEFMPTYDENKRGQYTQEELIKMIDAFSNPNNDNIAQRVEERRQEILTEDEKIAEQQAKIDKQLDSIEKSYLNQ